MQSYQERINEVLKYIHLHLDEPMDLEKLASIALVSKYHFHRIFRSFLGEPLGGYIKRVRVEAGAKMLKYSDSSVTEIAYKVGYENPTSFTKSFKNRFGVSPSKYRKQPNHSLEHLKKMDKVASFNLALETISLAPLLILCKQAKGLDNMEQTSGVWEKLLGYSSENNLLSMKTQVFSVHWDDPSITDDANLRNDACLSIDEEIIDQIDRSQFVVKRLAGGRYLRFTYQGAVDYIGDVYNQIFKDYIIKDNIRLRDEPPFDEYLTPRNHQPKEDAITRLYIPVSQ